jgi:hypothetical protein
MLLFIRSLTCYSDIYYTACEVVCGSKIDGVFLYYTDNLVSSGANFMCQVILSVIEDLTKLLQSVDQNLPRKAIFQFDNSGENKNKEVNALMSTLIEKFYLDEIHCNFLIVGHTHCSVDQYFGVCTKKIKAQWWIGSPLSFQNLLLTAHSDPIRRPTVNRQIHVVFDFRAFFQPILNKIAWCQVPHCFKFTMYLGKAIMQYKMFSPNLIWLPKAPDTTIRTQAELWQHPIEKIRLGSFCVINNEEELEKSLSIYDRKITEGVRQPALLTIVESFTNIRPLLVLLEQDALIQQQSRYDFCRLFEFNLLLIYIT